MNSDIKPVYLDADKCNGCVSCMKRCPTEAIRVRSGKATVMYERCVGCGECVKVCPTHAKKESCDGLGSLKDFKYTVALACPSIYAQFNHLDNLDYVLNGIKKLGFDDVYDVGVADRKVSAATMDYIKRAETVKPIISSSCPAVLNLIRMRYEHLLDHLSPMKQPEEVAAEEALKDAIAKTGLKREEIGIFLITHCAANLLNKHDSHNEIDRFVSFKEIYFPLLSEMNRLKKDELEPLAKCDAIGVSWGSSTGESMGLGTKNFVVADGIENVMTVLNDLEHDKLGDIDFLELNACTQGCVGGSMNIENPFLARTRLRLFREKLPLFDYESSDGYAKFERSEPYTGLESAYRLSENRKEAMQRMISMKRIYAALPHINCGDCGAPTCMAFAEDVVKGLDVKCKYAGEEKKS